MDHEALISLIDHLIQFLWCFGPTIKRTPRLILLSVLLWLICLAAVAFLVVMILA
jgi:hypothetical protein